MSFCVNFCVFFCVIFCKIFSVVFLCNLLSNFLFVFLLILYGCECGLIIWESACCWVSGAANNISERWMSEANETLSERKWTSEHGFCPIISEARAISRDTGIVRSILYYSYQILLRRKNFLQLGIVYLEIEIRVKKADNNCFIVAATSTSEIIGLVTHVFHNDSRYFYITIFEIIYLLVLFHEYY